MKYSLLLVFFFIYSIILFYINNYYILLLVLLFNILISIIIKVNFLNHLKILKKNLLFILFIFITNLIYIPLLESILIALRLFLVIDFSFTISNIFDNSKIQKAFYYILYPLKIFKIDINKPIFIISISLTFIPILMDEASTIKKSLILKGFKFNLKNAILKPQIFLITYINNLLDRLDELEKSLALKAYR